MPKFVVEVHRNERFKHNGAKIVEATDEAAARQLVDDELLENDDCVSMVEADYSAETWIFAVRVVPDDYTLPPAEDIPSVWDVADDYPVADWQHEVADDNTRLGYRDWVEHQRLLAIEDDSPTCNTCGAVCSSEDSVTCDGCTGDAE